MSAIPLGHLGDKPTARRGSRPPIWARMLRNLHWMLIGLGVGSAALGVVLAEWSPGVTVVMDPSAYRVGSTEFSSVGEGQYEGTDGAIVIKHQDGWISAAAATQWGGEDMTGRCELAEGASVETCRFVIGETTVLATDEWTGSEWIRSYNDGERVKIRGPRDVPVPLPIGR